MGLSSLLKDPSASGKNADSSDVVLVRAIAHPLLWLNAIIKLYAKEHICDDPIVN